MAAELFIGTSGWCYDCWRSGLYHGVPRTHWLRHYASHFPAVEVNASFYGNLRAATLQRWTEETPAGFTFTLKAHRYLTHVLKLVFPAETLLRQREAISPLAGRLTVMLWQLPAGLAFDLPRLEAFAGMLADWPQVRHALEFRHASWFRGETAAVLSRNSLAVCQSDAADWPLWDAVTTDLVYIRLHGHQRTYASAYGDEELSSWAGRIARWRSEGRTVHIYFDNTDAGHAPRDAMRLMTLLQAGPGATG